MFLFVLLALLQQQILHWLLTDLDHLFGSTIDLGSEGVELDRLVVVDLVHSVDVERHEGLVDVLGLLFDLKEEQTLDEAPQLHSHRSLVSLRAIHIGREVDCSRLHPEWAGVLWLDDMVGEHPLRVEAHDGCQYDLEAVILAASVVLLVPNDVPYLHQLLLLNVSEQSVLVPDEVHAPDQVQKVVVGHIALRVVLHTDLSCVEVEISEELFDEDFG